MKQKSKDDIKRQGEGGGNQQRAAHQGQPRQSSGNPEDDLIGMDEPAEVQQSAQREGMGHHRHSTRGNEQNLDATIDIDDLGSHGNAAGSSR